MFEAEVQRGMELIGDRWTDLDVDRLRMADVNDCVLGQLTGWYWSAEADRIMGYTGPDPMWADSHADEATALSRRHEVASHYGFTAGQIGFLVDYTDLYEELTEEWRSQIRAKRGALV